MVDHSSPEAYAFLIEADNKKVLYSGDFRATGRKKILFDIMLTKKELKEVDVLIMEGTMINRSNGEFPDEQSVEDKIYQTITSNNLVTFFIGSSQNIDSLVSAYRASQKAGKIFVVDVYTAWILEKLKIVSNGVPNISWDNVRVVKSYGQSYFKSINNNQEYFENFLKKVFNPNNFLDIKVIKETPSKYFLKVSFWYIEDFIKSIGVKEANIIYSQWIGYMEEKHSNFDTVNLYKRLKENNNFVYAHTSGHADVEALQKFTDALRPKSIIPIHTEYKADYAKYFKNVIMLEDKKTYNV